MSGFVCLLWEKVKQGIDALCLSPINKMNKTLKKMQEKSKAYKQKSSQEVEEQVKYELAGDSEAASQCSELGRHYGQLIKNFENLQFQIKKLIIKLEGVKATAEAVNVLEIGEAEVRKLQSALNVDDGNKLMNENNELMARSGQIQDSSPATSGAAADSNEAEMAV